MDRGGPKDRDIIIGADGRRYIYFEGQFHLIAESAAQTQQEKPSAQPQGTVGGGQKSSSLSSITSLVGSDAGRILEKGYGYYETLKGRDNH